MSFLFHKKKTPQELVKSSVKYFTLLAQDNFADAEELHKVLAKIADNVSQMKAVYVEDPNNPNYTAGITKLSEAIFETNIIVLMIKNLRLVDFETRKDTVILLSSIIRQHHDETVAFFTRFSSILEIIVDGYTEPDIALNCGSILRELCRYEDLCGALLTNPEYLDRFFGYIQLPTFDIASDAFTTLKTLLTKHKRLASRFLETNFDDFFGKYMQLLLGESYVTKRLGLKLLAELLLTRDNFTAMMKFINITDYLKITMSLLRANTKAIQLEAFHVFKIFVANPRKSDPIKAILYRNRDKLIEFLHDFYHEKAQADEQFHDERQILITTLLQLEPPEGYPVSSSQQTTPSSSSSQQQYSNNNTQQPR